MMWDDLANAKLTRRRAIVSGAAALAGGASIVNQLALGVGSPPSDAGPVQANEPLPPAEAGRDYNPVRTPNGETLAWKLVDGVKVFHLVAHEFVHEFAPGLVARVWGYNGRTPGPTIEVGEGDRLRFYLTNRLPAPTTIHWHGLLLPNGMDGVSGLNQRPVQPGETVVYDFTTRQSGTSMYHSHFDEMTQQALGLVGMFVIHPRAVPPEKRPHRDFVLMTHEWRIDPGTSRPDPTEMTDFNVLTFNGKAFPGTEPLVVRLGERVRIRLGNLSPMSHHPIHLHGYHFRVTETGGGLVPDSAQVPDATVLVPVGSTRAIEFVADARGDWALHCHMSHHTMNQMGHRLPNVIGVDTAGLDAKVRRLLPGYMSMGRAGMGGMGEHAAHMGVPENSIPMLGAPGPLAYIDMGGMFTVLKVRRDVNNYDDPGWYEHPEGTLASVATEEALHRDGIDVERVPTPPPVTKPAEDRAAAGGHEHH